MLFRSNAMLRAMARVHLAGAYDLVLAGNYRYESPSVYDGSVLAKDAAAGRVLGLQPLNLVMAAGGVIYDTRDNEYFPHDGSYHQVGLRGIEGIPFGADVRYAAVGAVFAIYRRLGGPFVFAARGLVDAQFGNVPFYDLYMGGPFNQDQMIGGSAAVRGVPEGRYLGKLKVIGNAELRAFFSRFHVFGQLFQIGGDLLVDAGHTWIDYTFSNPADGTGLGVHWGAGGGLYLRWGQAGVFRIEAAYSPDAVSENPSFPIGFYVNDNVMF